MMWRWHALRHAVVKLTSILVLLIASVTDGAQFRQTLLSSQRSKSLGRAMTLARAKPMGLEDAMKLAKQRGLSSSVLSLVSHKEAPDEQTLAKAKNVLNTMLGEVWSQLDDKSLECREFDDSMVQRLGQVTTDISRIGAVIADLQRQQNEAAEGGGSASQGIDVIKGNLKRDTVKHRQRTTQLKFDIQVQRNDLSVYRVLIELTKCKGGVTLLQADDVGPRPQVCKHEVTGEAFFNFGDTQAQQQLHQLSAGAAKQLRQLLGNVHAQALVEKPDLTLADGSSLLEVGQKESPLSNFTVEPDRAVHEWKPDVARCLPMTFTCAAMTDLLGAEWGKIKDSLDDLEEELSRDEEEFKRLEEEQNLQMANLVKTKADSTSSLAEVSSKLNIEHQSLTDLEQESREISHQRDRSKASCRLAIDGYHSDMCAFTSVRSALLSDSTITPPDSLTDCEVGEWHLEECSRSCDDACPGLNCGGWQMLTREVVVSPNPHGVQCPVLKRKRRCNQVKCPIDCVMSKWSGFSKCTKDCDGGVQMRTRSILTRPKNGGEPCTVVSEDRPCNGEACDQDCVLRRWTKWSSCSASCGGGQQEKRRAVAVPIRGDGKCPTLSSSSRLKERQCNAHKCVGDERCIAMQDLIIALDASGSLSESDFSVLRSFAVGFVSRYRSQFYGSPAAKIGVILFGNGELQIDGTVSPAIQSVPMTNDLRSVTAGIESLVWQRGLTNMAQALVGSETMLQRGGRGPAQSLVLVLTGGRPLSVSATGQKVSELADKNIQTLFLPVTHSDQERNSMVKWTSRQFRHLVKEAPDMATLRTDPNAFLARLVTTFCPKTVSLSATIERSRKRGYLLVADRGLCGPTSQLLYNQNDNGVKGCFEMAQQAGSSSFAVGRGTRRGYCYGMQLSVTSEMWDTWESQLMEAPTNSSSIGPECPPSAPFMPNSLYDFYGVSPAAMDLQ